MKANSLFTIILTIGFSIAAQAQSMVLIKVFDENMKALANLGLALDKERYYTTSSDGTIYLEVDERLLPPKTIKVNDPSLEAASWNYSKGILEVTVKRKSYKMIRFYLRDRTDTGLSGLTLKLQTPEPLQKRSSANGVVNMPIPHAVDLRTTSLLEVPGYTVKDRKIQHDQAILYLEPILLTKIQKPQKIKNSFDSTQLDSIQTLTGFYTFIRQIEIQKLNQKLKSMIDTKFFELLSQRNDSLGIWAMQNPIGKISDSSLVNEDITLLIEHALWEERNLGNVKTEFDDKIELIDSKLIGGGANLDEASRKDLIAKIERLDQILSANGEYFSQGKNEYHQILLAMKNRLLDIGQLEEKLTSVQNQRKAERKEFRDRLLRISVMLLGLVTVSFILLFLLKKINKQKKVINKAHQQLNKVNEHLEHLVLKRTQLLQQTNEELDTFMYRASHDLRRPITSILGLMQIAKMTLGDESLELCERVGSTARGMDRMLQKLIMVSHINQPCEPTTVDFNEFFRKYDDEFQNFTSKHNIELIWVNELDKPIATCPIMLDIIVRNLVDNALRFSAVIELQDNIEVVVSIHRKDEELILKVMDHAGGIDPEVQPKIWNMFFVGHERSQGNGLGLFITRRATEKLGAEITFKSNTEGTSFMVRIPVPKMEYVEPVELEEVVVL